MILPIYAYGFPVLKKVAEEVSQDYPKLEELLENMWETMYSAHGIGLAAPQIGLSVRIFLVDTIQIEDEENDARKEGIKKAFINASIIEESGDLWSYEEGCLSIPKLTGDVERNARVTIEYFDESFNHKIETFEGMNARVIQHEYDHIEGILFTERLKPLKKRLISRKLDLIKRGEVDTTYKMKFKV
jgi:peptide deformylase